MRRYLVSIHTLIDDLEFERALEQVARVKKVSKGPEDDVAVSLYEGVILAELSHGRMGDANASFKAALILDPDAKLPLSVSPKLMRQFEDVRARVLDELATRGEGRKPLEPPAPTPSHVPQPALATGALSSPAVSELSGTRSSLRDHALIPAVAGGVLVVTGGVFWRLAEREKSKLETPGSGVGSRDEARAVASCARSRQTVAVSLLAAGVTGLGIALGLHLSGEPETSVVLQPGADGATALVSGRWP
ncbi:hypothetical protein ACN47A_20480 [Myxococcus fulvus]|uniref:hypothetical protein n=1 Tax=Myxococcus fulvus TaxID=33 RepID=UPI003B9A7BB8